MATYTISLPHGQAQENTTPIQGTPKPWTEVMLQHVLALNPRLLGVEEALPIGLEGGSTNTSPDQLYLDEVGRLTVVEIKNERATAAALVQLLAYAEHGRPLPLGELSSGVRALTERGVARQLLGSALLAIRTWARGELASTDPEHLQTAGGVVLGLHHHFWVGRRARSVTDFAERYWGPHGLTLSGAPARMVLIAPSFDDEVVRLAKMLSKRLVAIELIEAELLVSPSKEPLLRWEVCHRDERVEPTWAAARRLWRLPAFREQMALNGWADHLSLESFSFSSREAPEVKLWIEYQDAGRIGLSTFVPDGWYEGAERKKLRGELMAALPEGFLQDRWLTWWFRLPEEGTTFDACALDIVDALHQVLVPLAGQF